MPPLAQTLLPLVWYENPAWYALGLAAISLAVSLSVFFIQRRSLSVTVQRGLVHQAVSINEAFLRYKVKGPFAHHLKISDDRVEAFTGKAVLLLNQVNLLRDVYDNRKHLGTAVVNSYGHWAKNIVGPWIEADAELLQIWNFMREKRDLHGEPFGQWLEEFFPNVSS